MSTVSLYIGGHVKPLRWHKAIYGKLPDDQTIRWFADLRVRGIKHEVSLFEIRTMTGPGWFKASEGRPFALQRRYREGITDHVTLAEAKVAAQVEWETLLRAAVKGS